MIIKRPNNAVHQTSQLVAAGVAAKIIQCLSSHNPHAAGATLDKCEFWSQWRTQDDNGQPLNPPWLQVVIHYPRQRSTDLHFSYCHPVTVAVESDPWYLAGTETLDAEQLALVEQLAGPKP